MEASGVIEPSCLPWASNVVVVTKHDKTLRITLDYRHLNNITYKDSYPLPNISDCLDASKGASLFAILDLRSSFYQVPLAEEDRDKTAFITRRGQWRFRSLLMGPARIATTPASTPRCDRQRDSNILREHFSALWIWYYEDLCGLHFLFISTILWCMHIRTLS